MPGYLLDTNIVSALMKAQDRRLAQRVARAGEANVFTSVIVAAELRFGALKKRSLKLGSDLDGMLRELEAKPFEHLAALHYGQLRADLEFKGTPIGANDMFVAAHALALDATLVTDNEREFRRIEGLRLEDWLR